MGCRRGAEFTCTASCYLACRVLIPAWFSCQLAERCRVVGTPAGNKACDCGWFFFPPGVTSWRTCRSWLDRAAEVARTSYPQSSARAGDRELVNVNLTRRPCCSRGVASRYDDNIVTAGTTAGGFFFVTRAAGNEEQRQQQDRRRTTSADDVLQVFLLLRRLQTVVAGGTPRTSRRRRRAVRR